MSKNERYGYSMNGKYAVRQYDSFEHEWLDIKSNLSLPDAAKLWDEKTDGGKNHTKYDDGYYYDIFPNSTIMMLSGEFSNTDSKK